MLAQTFAAQGLPPEWGPAFARTESGFVPTARSAALGDAKRGGSWGLCQVSFKTAQTLGYKGEPVGLLDPAINCGLAARLCRKNMHDYRVQTLQDVAALYNSGKRYKDAPGTTKTIYVVRVVRFAALYRLRLAQASTPTVP